MLEDSSSLSRLLSSLPPHLAERTHLCKAQGPNPRAQRVLYWTHHALRCDENPALDVAIYVAQQLQLPLLVYQGISDAYRFASDRHHMFMLEGARDLQQRYQELGISYAFHLDRKHHKPPRLARLASTAAVVVTEDFPLESTKQWTDRLVAANWGPVVLVDTACVVPTRLVGKAYDRAFAYRDATAKLYRERTSRAWPTPTIAVQPERELPFEASSLQDCSLAELIAECDIDHSVGPVADTRGGFVAGYARWQAFRQRGLKSYAKRRNRIEIDGVSRMSAYLHYGMVSPMRLAREAWGDGAEKFLDELLIWRELAYAFCHYRSVAAADDCLPAWAISTLAAHQPDPRRVLSWESLARAQTDQRLWNAAQRSLLKHGELHNNVRMTWGKALLAWSADYAQALERLVDLNHRYALDGRDPASYGGLLWCLGQFDRPFHPEQPVFGTVRTRPVQVHEQRTDIEAYERRVDRGLSEPAPRIAMIGCGLGGLICSRILHDHGLAVQCFDKSRRVGGRASTRVTTDGYQFDHGAQYFTIRDSHLQRYLDAWLFDKHVALWKGRVVSVDEPGKFRELQAVPRYVGQPSMQALAQHLSANLNVCFQTEVGCVDRDSGGYRLLATNGQLLGEFDIVLWNCPPQQTARQVPADCDWQARLSTVEMLPCWAVMLALQHPWDVPLDGAFVNQGSLSWICRDSSKREANSGAEGWVLHSAVEWAKQNLEASSEFVVETLCNEVERVIGARLPERSLAIAHRWLYARPLEPLSETALWDPSHRLGACGDWCGGPRVEGALLSGVALAGRVLGTLHESEQSRQRPAEWKQAVLFGELSE
jgi:photolyase PhrII